MSDSSVRLRRPSGACVFLLLLALLSTFVVGCDRGATRGSRPARSAAPQEGTPAPSETPAVAELPAPADVPAKPDSVPCTMPKLAPSEYRIWVEPKVIDAGTVELVIGTNIPGTIELMASINLAGQAPDDVWIGKDSRVRITRGEGSVRLNTAKLPSGKYDVEIDFYPKWGLVGPLSRASGVAREIHVSKPIVLRGSGESAADATFREEGQRWVMMNIEVGEPWDSALWRRKFGDMEELTVDRGNPDILKAYYFRSIDMTVIVNVHKGQIDTWRVGRAHS